MAGGGEHHGASMAGKAPPVTRQAAGGVWCCVLSALVAMALGAGVTLAFTQRGPGPTGVAAQQLRAGTDRAAGGGG